MAVRPTMAYIIQFVRELLNDVDSSNYQFTDQQIQDRLDLQRLDLYRSPLHQVDTLNTSGYIEWHDFFCRYGFLETDYVIQLTSGPVVTPDVTEPLIGKFHWIANQATPPRVLTGKVYNVYGVGATLMDMWVADIRSQISSWTADGTTVQRTGQIKSMQSLADKYRSMAWGWGNSTQIKLRRRDLRG